MRISSEVIVQDAVVGHLMTNMSGNLELVNVDSRLCKVLVVDDDPGLQRLIQRTLEPGAHVLQELNGDLEFELENVDVVILDYKLPGVDGLSLLEKIKGQHPDLPVIFMTGFGDLNIARKALGAGASEYFPKPFQPDDLRSAISRWVPGFDAVSNQTADLLVSRRVEEVSVEDKNFLTALDQKGRELVARVVRYNARTVVVEVASKVEVKLGEPFTNTCLTLGKRSMEVTGARVVNVSPLSDRNMLEIELPGIWAIEDYDDEVTTEEISQRIKGKKQPAEPQYSHFAQGVADREKIPQEYRVTVSDLVSIMEEIYDDLESCQTISGSAGTSERAAFEEGLIEQGYSRFFPAVTEAMDRFERAAELAEQDGMKAEFQKFAQRSLYPFLLCSPFIARVIHKPIGVPGDYGILGQILGNPFDGHSLFGRMLNGWVLSSHPAKAYRHRVSLLRKTIEEAIGKAGHRGERPKILSMASGVAFEVQQYIQNCSGNEEVDFELEDFSAKTLEEATRQFEACRHVSNPKGVNVNFRQSSVVELAKQAKETRGKEGEAELPEQLYDFVYCAGLFDYLSDLLCRTVIDYLFTLVRPGGTLIVSNYTPVNSLKNFMDFVLDWPLIYRSKDQFDALISKTIAKDCFTLETDKTGAEVYAIIKKPE